VDICCGLQEHNIEPRYLQPHRIYEDNALGRLPQNRYDSLLQTYGQEQETLEKEIEVIQSAVEKYEDDNG